MGRMIAMIAPLLIGARPAAQAEPAPQPGFVRHEVPGCNVTFEVATNLKPVERAQAQTGITLTRSNAYIAAGCHEKRLVPAQNLKEYAKWMSGFISSKSKWHANVAPLTAPAIQRSIGRQITLANGVTADNKAQVTVMCFESTAAFYEVIYVSPVTMTPDELVERDRFLASIRFIDSSTPRALAK